MSSIPPALAHKIWCMIFARVCNPKAYFCLAKTCKYFRKMYKRYSYIYNDESLSLHQYRLTSEGPEWYLDRYYTWAGLHFGRGEPTFYWISEKNIIGGMKNQIEEITQELLFLPYKGQIRKYHLKQMIE